MRRVRPPRPIPCGLRGVRTALPGGIVSAWLDAHRRDCDRRRRRPIEEGGVVHNKPYMPAEERFREMMRGLLAANTYPRHDVVLRTMGGTRNSYRSGLSREQGRWRMEEVEKAGYDWEASKRAGRLVRK